MKHEFSGQIFEKSSNIKFHENPSRGSQVLRTFLYSPLNHLPQLLVWRYFIFSRKWYRLWDNVGKIQNVLLCFHCNNGYANALHCYERCLPFFFCVIKVKNVFSDRELTVSGLFTDRELTVSLPKVWIKHKLCQCYGITSHSDLVLTYFVHYTSQRNFVFSQWPRV